MRYRLRTLLILLAVLPPLLGLFYWLVILENWNPTAANDRKIHRSNEVWRSKLDDVRRQGRELDEDWQAVENAVRR